MNDRHGRSIALRTIGDLHQQGYALSAHCVRRECGRHVSLDLKALIDRLGAAHSYLAADLVPKLRCRECGGRKVGLTLHAKQGYSPSP